MLRFDRLLVPVDFSKDSMAALKYAVALAKKLKGSQKVVVLHVAEGLPRFLESSSRGSLGSTEREQEMKRVACEELTRFLSRADHGEEIIESDVVIGHPASKMICEYAKKRGFDVVVIGSKGKGALERMVVGSTMQAVQRCSPCPVLSVKDPSAWCE